VPRNRSKTAPKGVVSTTPARSRLMGKIRQSGTRPELAVRAICTSIGLRYRTSNRDLPGSPDLANRTRRFAIFVHGCFWHRHPGCRRTTTPKANRSFWLRKFRQNVARDRKAVSDLIALGFSVVTIWECETKETSALKHRLLPRHPHLQ
jgi:DNA mismatch endonuclease, patch repair protein